MMLMEIYSRNIVPYRELFGYNEPTEDHLDRSKWTFMTDWHFRNQLLSRLREQYDLSEIRVDHV